MSTTLLTKVQTQGGEVTVITKTRFLFLLSLARTSVMPARAGQLGRLGVQFHWTTSDPNSLERLHNLLVQTLQEVTLAELRGIADQGKQLMSFGLPFIPQEAPLPDCFEADQRPSQTCDLKIAFRPNVPIRGKGNESLSPTWRYRDYIGTEFGSVLGPLSAEYRTKPRNKMQD